MFDKHIMVYIYTQDSFILIHAYVVLRKINLRPWINSNCSWHEAMCCYERWAVACIVFEVVFQGWLPCHTCPLLHFPQTKEGWTSPLSKEQIDLLEKEILSNFKTNPPPLTLLPLARSLGGHYGYSAVRFQLGKCVLVYTFKCQCIWLLA